MSTSLIFDDSSSSFHFDSKTWKNASGIEGSGYYGGSVTSVLSEPASFVFYFEGTSVAFLGGVALGSFNLEINATIAIDGSLPYNTSCSSCFNWDCQWYTTPMLPEGPHNVTLSNMFVGSTVDFAVVTTSKSLNEIEGDVIVDDMDPAFHFGAGWNTTGGPGTGGVPNAYGNGTHYSSVLGSEFLVNFTGTSISIYGMLDGFANEIFLVNYTIDDGPIQIQGLSHGPQGSENPNFMLFSSIDSLSNVPHQLKMVIAQADTLNGTQSLFVDYAVVQNGVSVNDTSSSTASLTSPSLSTPSSSPLSESLPQHGPIKTTLVGAVVGSVLGLFLLILGVIISCCWKKRKVQKQAKSILNYTNNLWYVEPFTTTGATGSSGRQEHWQKLQAKNAKVVHLQEQLKQATSIHPVSITDPADELPIVSELRQRIQVLMEENALLAEQLPPGYEEDADS